MNTLLWILQIVTALLYFMSGVMKVFQFDKISRDVPSFGALPKKAWTALGLLELICTPGLIAPSALSWHPGLSVVAAAALALESLIFIFVHLKYRERAPLLMSAVLGVLMAFIAIGRTFIAPIN